MSLSQMQVFDKYVMPAVIETLAQKVALFNQASNGSIVLSTEGFNGDFFQESFWKGIHSAQRRVDRYAANGTATATDLTQDKEVAVKVAGGFGPIRFEPSQLTWLQKPTAEGIEVISSNMAEAILADQLNTTIAALCAAIGNQASAVHDVSTTAGITYAGLNLANAKFGDHSSNIVANVVSGASYHAMIDKNLANAQNLFKADGVQVIDILGRAVIVTDAPALYVAGTPNKAKALGLVSGAAVVFDGSDIITNIQTTNGKERIETTMQSDYTFGLKLKGYAWDVANGGKSPLDAELQTGSNWDKVATSIKHTAGVLLVGDAAK